MSKRRRDLINAWYAYQRSNGYVPLKRYVLQLYGVPYSKIRTMGPGAPLPEVVY